MLKNVAIPLMLAATQAEARDDIRDAMEADREHPFAGFIADQAACDVGSNATISGEASKVSNAQKALTASEGLVTAAQAIGGAWTVADKARKDAVELAQTSEAAGNIAGLLDALDVAAEKERAAAKAYLDADKVFQAAVLEQAAAQARVDDSLCPTGGSTTFCTYTAASTAAANAVIAAKAQHTKELLWREWLYCELGAGVAGSSTTNWWAASQTNSIATAGTAPASCIVPQVDSSASAKVRGAVTYYNSLAGLSAEKDDGTSRWTATLKLTTATNAEASTTWAGATLPSGGIARNYPGAVMYRTAELKNSNWLMMRRTKEKKFYDEVVSDGAAAKLVAASASATNTYDWPSASDPGMVAMGTTANTGAAPSKALLAAKTARNSATTGSVKRMPASRAQSSTSGEEWMTVWTLNAAGMDAWTGANTSAGAAHLWWALARDVSVATAAWHTYWNTHKAVIAIGSFETTQVGTAKPCNTGTGTWTTAAGGTSAALCKTACETQTFNNLVVQLNSGVSGHNGGGRTMARWDAAASYCGAYSYTDTTGSTICKLLQNSITATATTQVNAGDVCFTLDKAKAIGDLQVTLQQKYALLVATPTGSGATATYAALVAMQGEMDTQAGLEKAWLQAWYLQQYWVAVDLQLNTATSGSIAKVYGDAAATLALATTANNSNLASLHGATYQAGLVSTALDAVTETLATLQTATASAQSVVSTLGTRILRTELELAELAALVNVAATGGTAGTLDEAAAKRLKTLTDYTNGEKAAALVALNAAKAKTAVTAAPGYNAALTGTADTVYEARARAAAKWTLAQKAVDNATPATGEVKGAKQNLEAALGTANLATLRQSVTDETTKWDKENVALGILIADVVNKTLLLEKAKADEAKVILDCQKTAYDAYRTSLQAALEKRAADLATIKALLEKQVAEKPARGKAGARCEKALSNGTWRPARDATTCDEGLCCGASRVWMTAGDGTVAAAAWRTVETCQTATATTYQYQPARAPLALTMPAKVPVDFTCIQGAKTLAAAASAVAAAVYMLA